MDGYRIASGLIWYIVFLFSTTFHEAAHAFFAWKGGDSTAYHGGQVSLSPIPHMRREPLGMVILPLFMALTQGQTLGWASTPYDPRWEARYPRRAALMAAAGPGANFVLALVSFMVLKIGRSVGWFWTQDALFRDFFGGSHDAVPLSYAGQVLAIVLVLNVLLFILNLIPFPPLDGASALGLFLTHNAARQLQSLRSGPYASMIGMVLVFFGFRYVSGPIVSFVILLLKA
jgi:Zn-dependent protease